MALGAIDSGSNPDRPTHLMSGYNSMIFLVARTLSGVVDRSGDFCIGPKITKMFEPPYGQMFRFLCQ